MKIHSHILCFEYCLYFKTCFYCRIDQIILRWKSGPGLFRSCITRSHFVYWSIRFREEEKVNDAIKIIMARSRSRERSRSRDRRHKSSKKSRRSRRSRSRSRSRSRTPKRYSTSSRHYKSSRSHYSSRRDRRRGSSSDSDHSSSSNSDRNSSEVRTIPLTSATAAGIGNKDIAVNSAAAKKKILEVERLAEIERQK